VAGAGSGGLGAALAGARGGGRVLLVEAADQLGGTVTRGGVMSWEPVVGATGLPAELYHRARALPSGAGCVSCRNRYHPDRPYGLWLQDPRVTYADTLQRSGLTGQTWHAVALDPEAYLRVVQTMLAEAGVEVRLNCRVVGAEARDGHVEQIVVEHEGRAERLSAVTYVDSTAEVHLCRQAGCATRLGEDPRSAFGEPSAPVEPLGRINAVSLLYRARPTAGAAVAELPADIPADLWRRAAHIVELPDHSRVFNVLPTMEGRECLGLGPEAAYAECRRRILAHWHWTQTTHGYERWELCWVAPTLGVREGPRVMGEQVLTEHDLDAGVRGQAHDDIIALADHAKDVHGEGGGCPEVREPYGVPYRCLVPRGFSNLLVACRGASFSHIGASSCRLSRTMMQLGQAAGTAAALAVRLGCRAAEVPPATLRQRLREQGVQLEWDGWHAAPVGSLEELEPPDDCPEPRC
jgi:hypothetical protein